MGRSKQFSHNDALEGAMCEFWKRGYHATSIPRLESAMGIRRQSIYDSFKSKRALFLQVLEYYQQNIIEKNLSPLEVADSPKQAICEYFIARAEDAIKDDVIKGCLLTNSIAELAQHDKAIRDQTNVTLSYMKNIFYKALIKSKQLNEISNDLDANSGADFLVNSAQGLFILSRMNPTKSSVNGVVLQIEKLLAKK